MMPYLEFLPRLNLFEAQQKMHYAFRRSNGGIKDVSDGVYCSKSMESLALDDRSSLKDHEVSAVMWWNSYQRFFSFTLITLQTDSNRKSTSYISDNSSYPVSGANEMDGLCLFSPQPVVSFQVGAQRVKRSYPPNLSCSTRSLMTKSSSESSVRRLSKSTSLVTRQIKVAKISKVSGSSEQKAFILNGSSDLVSSASNVTTSADRVKDTTKADNPAKKSSSKKGQKKGKRLKNPPCINDSTVPEAFSEVGIHINSISGTSYNIDPPLGDGPITQHSLTENDMESTKENGCGVKHSVTHGTLTSYSSSVDESEAVVPRGPQNVNGDDRVLSSINDIHPTGPVLSTFNLGVVDTHLKQPNCCKNISFEVFTVHRTPTLGSVSDSWNSDDCTSAGDCTDEKSSNKEDGLSQSSEYIHHMTSFSGPGKRYLLHGNFLPGVDDDKNAERAKSGNWGCRNGGLHSVVSGKRGKQGRELSGSSIGALRLSSGRNVHGRAGKENNHSVCQKVQKDNANEFICESVATPIRTQKGVSHVDNSDLVLKSHDDNNNLEGKVSEKLTRKPRTGPKQDNSNSYRKGPHSSKTNVVWHKKSNMQRKEASEIPLYKVSAHKSFSSGSRSICYVDCQRAGVCQTESVKGSPSEPVQNSRIYLDDVKPCGSVSTSLKNVQAASNQNSTSPKSSELLDPNLQAKVFYPDNAVSRPSNLQAKVFYPDNGKQEHTSRNVLKKWVPVLRKDAEITGTARQDNLLMPHVDESLESRWTVKRTESEENSSNSNLSESSMDVIDALIGSSSSNINHPPTEDKHQADRLRCTNTCLSGEHCITSTAANRLLTQESQAHYGSVSETDSNKIEKAVSDAYRIQLTSEGVQMVTGCPLAEFERLLHSASPILGQTHCVGHCQYCMRDQPIGISLCRHEILDVSLGSLWRWYEKHGSYGLEVKAENYQNFKRLGIDHFEFCAYFVPFLSAVQLFGNSSSHSVGISNGISRGEMLNACNTNIVTKGSSNIGHLPILSVLLPQPSKEVCVSEPLPSYGQDDLSNNSLATERTDEELLFEYFESEQPHQRRPLFEKIKELVRGDGPSNCRAYGDATKLDSMDLHDLHPSSWYSVAWYPIYRIPDGNFRTAFLTYHSLGHFIKRSTSSDSTACIVSPVVGLQSYNAQEECWLQLKQLVTVNTEETSGGFNRSDILKERLRTLQATASVMARTVVNKGDARFVNQQPDYEFFLSRQRWQNADSN